MPYAPFHEYFRETAERETRTVTVLPQASLGLPPADYSLLEMYCDEPGCDCRRVFFYILSSLKQDVVAVIAYGWESPEFYARWMGDDDREMLEELRGPILNMSSPQSELAPALLELVKNAVLCDKAYVARLKSHYRIFRARIDNKKSVGARKKSKRGKK